MNKVIARCIMICSVTVWLIISFTAPWVLSDNNTFLKEFVNHGFLGFLGFIVTITLASAANLHLELNKFEESKKERIFFKTKESVKKSAYWLVGMLFVGVLIVVIKPISCKTEIAESLFNGSALVIVFFNILVLTDLTQSAFKIEPIIDKRKP